MATFIAFMLSFIVLVPMSWLLWESTVLVDKKIKQRHGVSSGEQQSKKKHMDDIL